LIYDYNDLSKIDSQKIIFLDGGFDPLHNGHLKYFELAKAKFNLEIFCNIQGDHYMEQTKKRPSILPEEHRAYLIHSLKTVSHVHICKTSTADILSKVKPAIYIKGLDWKTRGLPQEELDICRENNTEIVYMDSVLNSSTDLVKDFVYKYCELNNLQIIEKV
jgi:cytidyltransferase-like protein